MGKIHRLKKFPPALHPNRMLFETNDDFTDNGRALFDYLVENGYNQKYELVWLVHDPKKYEKYQAPNVKFVQSFKKGSTIRRAIAYRYALTSGYIFYTQAFNWIGMSRKNQLFIDLWHGCGYKANKRITEKCFLIIVSFRETFLLRRRKSSLPAVPKKSCPLGIPGMI